MPFSRRAFVLAGLLAGVVSSAQAVRPPTPEEVAAFFRAVQLDDLKTVERMVGAVVNANERNPVGGDTALVLALREDAPRVFSALLAHPGTDLEATAANGNTALMMAAFKRNKNAVEALLDKGAKLNRPGWTALHYAAAAGDDDIAELLIGRGARVDAVSPRQSGGYTPLMMAAREGHASTAMLLLKRGAKAKLKNNEGLTAAQIAERAGRTDVVRALSGATS
ncbi:ankyrin repeat domain-containing protein [Massilia sp. ST3]|uniref:ankyrin repeat domain-containing protein n=1 Tax=Massilia sp. ST3 TaxID=2824903 RepID=UPI001B83E788|nr:ankyrin repeat domain-containing protein [Massilia sp. ST3]MBQ5945932.1 ankyrin repeat domain-containing protein [Massilia sp. ST3]